MFIDMTGYVPPPIKKKSMGIETIEYKGKQYPLLQSEGFASQYAFPFADKILKGFGVDVGCMKKEWAYPKARPIDLDFPDEYHALNLPLNHNGQKWDYIFSSNMLEHVDNWVTVLDYWQTMLNEGGVLMLYLPHYKSEYWRVWNNLKHRHNLKAKELKAYLKDRGWAKVFTTGYDLNYCFYVIAEKI